MISVTFDRTTLGLAPLVITDNPFEGDFHVPEDGLGATTRGLRRTYAPDSNWIGGRSLLAAVPEAQDLALVVYAHADSTAALEAARAVLDAAAGQWDYDLTVTIDGVGATYRAEPELPQWGAPESGMVRAHMDRAALLIPIFRA